MLYYLLRIIFRISNKFYFNSFQVIGRENIPEKGPVFFVANHPSAFMDPIVIATITKRRLFFLAKGSLFKSKFAQWILPKFNMIPIFSSDEVKGQGSKNKEIFARCYEHFAKGGAILVFPEGVSITERKIKKIQSGTARICLGAEAENNFSLGIKIIPIGLNFSDPHSFHSNLLINIDKPIVVSDFYEVYKEDTFKGARVLTDTIRERLEQLIITIQDAELDKLVSKIELIYKSQLLQELGFSLKDGVSDFETTKAISDSVHYFVKLEPERVDSFKKSIYSYLDDLDRLKLKDVWIRTEGSKPAISVSLKSIAYFIIGFPLFLFGLVNNFLPFKLPSWMARFISKRSDFFGSIALTVGTFTFLIFYSLQIWLVNHYLQNWKISLAYAFLLPISGLFANSYYHRFIHLRGKWAVFSLFNKKTTMISSLMARRNKIIDDLNRGKDDFLKQT